MLLEIMRSGFIAVAIGYGLLLLQLQLMRHKRHRHFRGLPWALSATVIWATAHATNTSLASLFAANLLYLLSWLYCLIQLPRKDRLTSALNLFRPWQVVLASLVIAMLGYTLSQDLSPLQLLNFWSMTLLLGDLIAIWLLIQALRHKDPRSRIPIRYLALGMGAFFILQAIGYSQSVFYQRVEVEFLASQPYLKLFILPFLIMFIAHSHRIFPRPFISHQAALIGGATLLGAIVIMASLLILLLLKIVSGPWAGIMQISYLFVLLPSLLALLLSRPFRQRVSNFIHKNILTNKYDYRRAWIRMSSKLADQANAPSTAPRTSLLALMDLMDCASGGLWLVDKNRETLSPQVELGLSLPELDNPESLLRFSQQTGWVIDLTDLRHNPEHYQSLSLDPALDNPRFWLLLPIYNGSELLAMALLGDQGNQQITDWEDHDLLKTAARQLGNYLALSNTLEALSQARQFEAFNRMSAFVVHDLKNTLFQLEMLAKNLNLHRENPAFIDDGLETLENVVGRMRRLLDQLRQKSPLPSQKRAVDVDGLLAAVVNQSKHQLPVPRVLPIPESIQLVTDQEQLQTVLCHLVENAQQATPEHGSVWLSCRLQAGHVVIDIGDTGCGMSQHFIQQRLFKPFQTTKQNAGMGIGVYEAKQFVTSQGGRIDVASQPGQGTVFSLYFPSEIASKHTYLKQQKERTEELP